MAAVAGTSLVSKFFEWDYGFFTMTSQGSPGMIVANGVRALTLAFLLHVASKGRDK
jgi:hypothetical protein